MKTYLKELDSLRALAALAVVLHHFGPTPLHSKALQFLFHCAIPDGSFGVDLFFVLSGFLITSILLDAKEQSQFISRKTLLKNFIVRRSLRLFPIYFLLIGVLFVINYPGIRDHLFFYLTYTSNFLAIRLQSWDSFSHTWTLSVEEQFYLIWPWIILFVSKRYLLHVILIFIQVGILSSLLTSHQFSPYFQTHLGIFNSILTPNCFHAFGIGALLAVSRTDERISKYVLLTLQYLLPAALIMYLANRSTFFTQFEVPSLTRLINAIISATIIAFVLQKRYPGWIGRILNNHILVYLGKISYGIYLYHYVIGLGLRHLLDPRYTAKSPFPNQYVYSLAIILITIIVAMISYHMIEKPFLNLKKYFDTDKSNRLLKTAPASTIFAQPITVKTQDINSVG